MPKKIILCIVFSIITTNSIYSQEDSDIIIWQFNDNFSFSVIVPQGWVAIENMNPQKSVCYNFYINDNIYANPSIFIAFYLLKEATDDALNEIIERTVNNGQYAFSEINYNYRIGGNIITYDMTTIQGPYFSRNVFIRYKQYGLQIDLSSLYEKPENELITVLDELVGSLIFYDK
jgi:hypothetical protein